MTRRLVLAVLALLLVGFLAAPQAFAPLLAPLAANNAPAIYTQSSLLGLTLSHLGLVAAAVSASVAVALGLAILVTRPAGAELLPLARTIAAVGQTFPPVAVLALRFRLSASAAGRRCWRCSSMGCCRSSRMPSPG